MNTIMDGTKVKKACIAAIEAFKKLDKQEYFEIISGLEYCIASYDYDHNPVGLFEHAELAYHTLSEVRQDNPRKISKKLLDELEKSFSE
jgi:hypothetical protein